VAWRVQRAHGMEQWRQKASAAALAPSPRQGSRGKGCPGVKTKHEAQQHLDTALTLCAGHQSAKSRAKRRPAKAANREGEVCAPRRRERAMHAREVLRARAWVDEGDTGTMPDPAGSKPCSSFSVAWYIASYIT